MRPDRFARAKEILLALADLAPAERQACLDRECAGDAELRAEVESILAHDGQATAQLAGARAGSRDAPSDAATTVTIGQTLSHYRILRKLGAGGMGEVYLAHDERLDREVALKVLLRGALEDEDARRRLRKEALALSKLNHPSIATVFDFDTQEGVDFLVMEYMAGAGLEEKLASGPLPEREVLRLGQQMAEGLAAAHRQGVVHRDLKPSNVRLTSDGRLKLLDFGLAKHAVRPGSTATATTLAQTGALVGTLPYMAPEQVRGEAVDARTDLWAAGLVLYELATGRRAYGQAGQGSVIAAIMSEAPPVASRVNARISAGLDAIIGKCLEKDPERRYQSAKELAVDLRRLEAPSTVGVAPVAAKVARGRPVVLVGVAAGAIVVAVAAVLALDVGGLRDRVLGADPKIRSLAVLPLRDVSVEPQPDYFTAGMTEGLISELGKVAALHVVGSDAVARFKGAKTPPAEIARELNVGAVVTGSIARTSDRVRISAQMIQAGNGRQLWAGSYERDLREVQFLQGGMAQTIANVTRLRLAPEEQARLAGGRPVIPEAYEAYLQAASLLEYPNLRAAPYLRQAIRIDSTFAPAHAKLAECYVRAAIWGEVTPGEAMTAAVPSATRALELDGELAQAHLTMAYVKFVLTWDFAGARQEYLRGVRLSPGDRGNRYGYAMFCVYLMENQDEAVQMALDDWSEDKSSEAASMAGWTYFYLRRYDDALEWLQRAHALPGFAFSWLLSLTYACKGMCQEALAMGDSTEWSGANGWVLAVCGRRDLAQARLDELRRRDQAGEYVSAFAVAATYAGLGNKDEAFAWLRRGVAARDIDMISLKVEPVWDGLRSDPRFDELLRLVGLPPRKH